ncbi:hypothetical protein ABPG72_010888 [Tetrahymena utriculariae]
MKVMRKKKIVNRKIRKFILQNFGVNDLVQNLGEFQIASQENQEEEEYEQAWEKSSLIQKIIFKITYSNALKSFKWPLILDGKNFKFFHRTNIKNKVYYACEMYRSQCSATCQIDISQSTVILNLSFLLISNIFFMISQLSQISIMIRSYINLKRLVDWRQLIQIRQINSQKAKQMAQENPHISSQTIYTELQKLNKQPSIILPTKQDLSKIVNNHRSVNQINLNDLSWILKTQFKGKPSFGLQIKCTPSGKTIHFSSNFQMRQMINDPDHQFFIDGYRKSQTKIYLPVFHILMTGQSEELYAQALQDCKDLVQSKLKSGLKIKCCTSDYALFNALKKVFPTVTFLGACFIQHNVFGESVVNLV